MTVMETSEVIGSSPVASNVSPNTSGPTSAPWPAVFSVTLAVMIVVAAVMGFGLFHQVRTYQELISSSVVGDRTPLLLALSRSLDAAVVKTSSLLVAFLLVFLGGLYTLRVGESAFRLTLSGSLGKGALQTASPGLVMLALGVAVVAVSILKEQTVDLSMSVPANAPAPTPDSTNFELKTSSASDFRVRLSDETIRTLTAVIALAPNPDVLREADRKDWASLKRRIERLREEIALERYPKLAPRYSEFVALELQNRDGEIDARDPELARQFREVRKLLGSVALEGGVR